MSLPNDNSVTLIDYVDLGGESMDSLSPATNVIAGRYEILGLLGAGGMGSVFRVRDRELNEVVALKRLRSDLVDRPGMANRFREEVRLARKVTHPNVVRTYDLGEHDGERFITMQYVDGPSLGCIIERRGRLCPARAVEIACMVGEGLAAAHDAGVLHKDLKPVNVLMTEDGVAQLSDFGIAGVAFGQGVLHGAGLQGTPAYMAPEQVRPDDVVGPKADLYALGCVLFEMLTGRRAWPGHDPFQVALARLSKPPPVMPADLGISPAISGIVARLLASNPQDRFSDVHAALAALRAVHAKPAKRRPEVSALGPDVDARTLAVLPLRYRGDPSHAWRAEALTEELIDALSATRGLRVRPFTAVQHLTGHRDAQLVGGDLQVVAVAQGVLKPTADGVSLRVRVIAVEGGYQLWSGRYNAAAGAELSLADTVAHEVAHALSVELTTATRPQATDSEALELYLHGRALMRKHWHTGMGEVLPMLASAAERAPTNPTVLSAYAQALARKAFHEGQDRAPEADKVAMRAVSLGPGLGEPWMALATVRMYATDSAGAVAALRTAIERAPGLVRAHDMLGMILMECDRLEEAQRHVELGVSLDPKAPLMHLTLARLHALNGRWTDVERVLAVPADEPAHDVARQMTCLRLANWRGRRHELQLPPPEQLPESMDMIAALRGIDHVLRTGDIPESFRARFLAPIANLRGRHKWIRMQIFVEVALTVGDADAALDVVEELVSSGFMDLAWMRRCPAVQSLRSRPRWSALEQVVAARVVEVG